MVRRRRWIYLATIPLGMSVVAVAQENCRARIAISVDAEVPDARDPSFLSGLLADPQYRLTWVSGDSDLVIFDLSGPAGDPDCASMVEQIRRSAAVLEVKRLDDPPLD